MRRKSLSKPAKIPNCIAATRWDLEEWKLYKEGGGPLLKKPSVQFLSTASIICSTTCLVKHLRPYYTMHCKIQKALATALAIDAIHVHAFPTPMGNAPSDNTELIGQLITTPTQIKRYQKLLTEDSGKKLLQGEKLTNATIWDFNINLSSVPGGQGGSFSSANLETFPYLINSGVTLTMGSLGPCGFFLPHVHPRANEFFVVTEGEVEFGTLLETGLLSDGGQNREITEKMTKNQGTLFPQGSVHYQINNSPDCRPATAFATLTSEDAGTNPILMDSVPQNVTVGAGMRKRVDVGDFESVRAVTPLHIAKVVEECIARCHLS